MTVIDRRFACPAVLLAAALAAEPALACTGLADGPSGVVAKVFDGDTFELDSGVDVRLAGIRAPRSQGARAAAKAEPLATEARTALASLLLGQAVRLSLDREEMDRYRHMQAQVFVGASGAWVQQEMLRRGLARVEPLPGTASCATELLADEATARSNGLGIWSDPYYSVRDGADSVALAAEAGHYEIVEGEVVGTGDVRGRFYLDFGRVWKDDVTATIDPKAHSAFADAGIVPSALRGRRVRVRGYVEIHDGPLIELTLPAQIEVLTGK